MNLPPKIFDRKKIQAKFLRNGVQSDNFMTSLMVDDMSDRLAAISRKFNKALVLAPHINHLPKTLTSMEGAIKFEVATSLVHAQGVPLYDPENFTPAANDYDLIITLFDITITNDVPGFLSQILKHLTPDGLFIAGFIGGGSLRELRAAWLEADAKHLGGAMARIPPFIDVKDAGALLHRAGFALPVSDIEKLTLRYASPLSLMAELKIFGASNPLYNDAHNGNSPPVTQAHLASVNEAYARLGTDEDGRIRASMEMIWMSGWAPHISQPKPLKPGSAKVSLAQALGKK